MSLNETLLNVTINKPKTIQLNISEWLLIGAFSLIIIIGVLGNSFVIYVFGYRRKKVKRSTTEWLILFLGITDFLSTIFNSSLFLYWTATRHSRWDFGYVGCKILPAIGPILITVSSGVILIFAIDRYVAIVQPFHGQLSLMTASVAIVINIILSILSYTHYIYMIDVKMGRCVSRPVNDLAYGIPNCTLIIIRLFVFASVFIFTSVRIFFKLRNNESTASVKANSFYKGEKGHRQSKKIACVLFMVGCVFILLVFPRELFYLVFNMSWIISTQGIQNTRSLLHMNSWLKVMHTANCCANIFIYAHMHSRVRRIIFRRCCGSWKEESSFSSETRVSGYNSITNKAEGNHEYTRALNDEVSSV